MAKLYIVWSDNVEGAVLTERAYKELRLQMSTGDFHTHKAVLTHANWLDPNTEVWDLDDTSGDMINWFADEVAND